MPKHVSRCPFCETTVEVSARCQPFADEAPGVFFLAHAPFNLRCPGTGSRVEVYWRPGEEPWKEGWVL